MSASPLLFHMLPGDLVGDRLVPLSELKGISPQTYAAQASKYAGREIVTARRIPHLECFWNDVLHLSPVHPEQVRDGLRSEGLPWKPKRWLAVDAERAGITHRNAVIWTYPKHLPDGRGYSPEDCTPYDAATVQAMTQLPATTTAYYRSCHEQGRAPLLFVHVPHVFFKGFISVNEHEGIDI